MGDATHQRQPDARGSPLAAFDFDGTLTTRDSFIAFLAWRAGPWRFALCVLALAPAALAWLVHGDRGRFKAAAVRRFLTGAPRADLAADAEAFAAAGAGRLLRTDALAAWRDWRAKGARLVIVTASPEPIVAPFARRLGADLLIGTRLAYDEAGRVTGALDGENCRGPEKARRLKAVFGEDVRLVAAYGDSRGDREMLDLATERGMKVFRAGAGS